MRTTTTTTTTTTKSTSSAWWCFFAAAIQCSTSFSTVPDPGAAPMSGSGNAGFAGMPMPMADGAMNAWEGSKEFRELSEAAERIRAAGGAFGGRGVVGAGNRRGLEMFRPRRIQAAAARDRHGGHARSSDESPRRKVGPLGQTKGARSSSAVGIERRSGAAAEEHHGEHHREEDHLDDEDDYGGDVEVVVGRATRSGDEAHDALSHGEAPEKESKHADDDYGAAAGAGHDLVHRAAGVWRRCMDGCFGIAAKGAAFVQVRLCEFAIRNKAPPAVVSGLRTCFEVAEIVLDAIFTVLGFHSVDRGGAPINAEYAIWSTRHQHILDHITQDRAGELRDDNASLALSQLEEDLDGSFMQDFHDEERWSGESFEWDDVPEAWQAGNSAGHHRQSPREACHACAGTGVLH